jgi:hypothetical protein
MAIAMVVSVIAFFIGLYKVLFQKEDKEFGIKLLIYSTIIFIIGAGTCSFISLQGNI